MDQLACRQSPAFSAVALHLSVEAGPEFYDDRRRPRPSECLFNYKLVSVEASRHPWLIVAAVELKDKSSWLGHTSQGVVPTENSQSPQLRHV